MKKNPIIKKASGEQEPFSIEKLENSLKRSGAKDDIIASIKDDIWQSLYDGISTRKIYKKAFELLRKEQRSMAARYSLKKAIMQFGPTGYPFEHFVAQILACQGYKIKIGKTIQGHCVTHEVDVIATNNDTQCLIECKFYNSQGKYCSVQVPLYIRSRVDDIVKKREQLNKFENFEFQGWVVTNTRFTTEAIDYGLCAGLTMVSWDFPKKSSLKYLVEKHRIFPITVLTHLTKKHKEFLLENGIVICRQLIKKPNMLDQFSMTDKKRELIIKEANELCV